MAKLVQKVKAAPAKQAEVVQDVEAQIDEEAEKLKAETDELLDEIDGLLEENAEEFVRNYVQKGGQMGQIFLERVKIGVNIFVQNVVQWKYENMRSI